MWQATLTTAAQTPVIAGGSSPHMYGVVILVVVLALCIGMTALVGWAERRKHAGPGKPIHWRVWSKNMAILAAFGSVLVLLGYFFLGLLGI